jgi:hypothetical protein
VPEETENIDESSELKRLTVCSRQLFSEKQETQEKCDCLPHNLKKRFLQEMIFGGFFRFELTVWFLVNEFFVVTVY